MNQLSLTSFPASEASASDLKAKDSAPSDSPKSISPPAACSNTTGQMSPTLEIFAASPEQFSDRLARLMSLQEEFLASLQVLSDKCAVLKTSVGCGPKQSDWLAKLDPSFAFLRTRQVSLFSMGDENSTEFYQGFPRSGMICGGMLFPLQQSVQDISENVSSLSLPTPWASANEERQTKFTPSQEAGKHGLSLNATVHSVLLPTLVARPDKRSAEAIEKYEANGGKASRTTERAIRERSALLLSATARDWKDTPGMARETEDGRKRDDQLPRRIFGDESVPKGGGMKMSLEFRCWFMGFPTDWLKPLVDAPETQSSRKSRKSTPAPSVDNSIETPS